MNGRRPDNGQGDATAAASVDTLAAELAELEAAITATGQASPPLADQVAAAHAELEACAAEFHRWGLFARRSVVPAEQQHHQHRVLVGALMTIGRDALLQAEHNRVRALFEASGALGLSTGDKAERLGELRRRRRRLLAAKEMTLRGQEADGELIADAGRDPELFLASDADLQSIAEGSEQTAG